MLALLATIGLAAALCPDQTIRAPSADPAAPGPYDVGTKTVTITRKRLTTEIWYPAPAGSGANVPVERYDVREFLPRRYNNAISDDEVPWVDCERGGVTCHRDLPVAGDGRFPVIVFIHGSAGFRYQSLAHCVHWASRGFIVMAADHPGISLESVLAFPPEGGADQAGDARLMLRALEVGEPPLEFLLDAVDLSRVGVTGHSAGGGATSTLGDVADVLIPMAAGGAFAGPRVVSTLVLGGIDDGIVPYSSQQFGFETSPSPARLVGISRSGHHVCSELCYIGREDGGLAQIAISNGIFEALLFRPLAEDGCDYDDTDADFDQPEVYWPVVNHATAAAFEEVLMCNKEMGPALDGIADAFDNVGEYRSKGGLRASLACDSDPAVLEIEGGAPGAAVALVFAPAEGSFQVPGDNKVCPFLELGVDSIRTIRAGGQLDANGAARVELRTDVCDLVVVAVDTDSCEATTAQ